MDEPDGPIRLRESGVGVAGAGIVLFWTALVAPPWVSASAVLLAAAAWYVLDPPIGNAAQIALGMVFVGLIALIEASPLGIGIDHLILGFIALALGMFDIVIGLTIQRWRRSA